MRWKEKLGLGRNKLHLFELELCSTHVVGEVFSTADKIVD